MSTGSQKFRRQCRSAQQNSQRAKEQQQQAIHRCAKQEKCKATWLMRQQQRIERYRDSFRGAWLTRLGLGLAALIKFVSAPFQGEPVRQDVTRRRLFGEGLEARQLLAGDSFGPVVTEDSSSTPGIVSVLENDDPAAISVTHVEDSTSLVGTAVTLPLGGIVTINSAGETTFDPAGNYQFLNDEDAVNEIVSYTNNLGQSFDVTIQIAGVNDDATIAGDLSDEGNETTGPLTLGGSLTSSDVDNIDNQFIPQTDVNGTNGYGTFSFSDTGVWGFVANDPFDELAAGEAYTDAFEVASVDGTSATVSVTIYGTNDAPTISTASADQLEADLVEDALTTASGTLNVEDVDLSDTVTATVSAEPTGLGAGMLTLDTANVISDTATTGDVIWTFDSGGESFDHLAQGQELELTYEITVTDDSAPTPAAVTETVTVTITGANDAPTILVASADELEADLVEDALTTASGTLNVEDVDVSDTVTAAVSLEPTGLGAGMLTLDTANVISDTATTGDVTWTFDSGGETFDHLARGQELELTYEITVTDDSAPTPAAVTETVTVTITGANDAPTILVALADELEADLVEDALTTASGTLNVEDVDVSDTVTATVSAEPTGLGAGMLTLNTANVIGDTATTGDVTWTFDSGGESFDHLAQGQELELTYEITVTDDSAPTPAAVTETVTVTITGANDAPTILVASADELEADLVEDALTTASRTLNVKDVDLSDTVTAAVSLEPTGLGAGMLTLNTANVISDTATTGDVIWTFDSGGESFDHLAQGQELELTYEITVDDGSSSETATATKMVVITITGTNDAPVANPDSTVTAENIPTTSAVVANDTDVDDGTGPSDFMVTSASIASGDGFAVALTNSLVFYDPSTFYDYLDSGDVATVLIDYTIEDTEGASSSSVLTVSVTGENDAPVLSGGTTVSLDENAANDAIAFDGLVATDVDAGETLEWAIDSGNDSGAFAIDSNGVITVADSSQLDFESAPSFSLVVSVTDGDATATNTVTINLNDLNESPTVSGGGTVAIDENTADDTVVFDALSAADPDGNTLTWAIDSGNESGAFAIDSNGVITVADSSQLDFETVESFTLVIGVTDGGELSATDTVTINLNDLNESPTLAGGDTVSIDENTPDATVVFDALVADDPDGDTLIWTIDSGNESGAFAIDSNGVITVADSSQLDFETVESITLVIGVTDGGELSATDTVTINLNDLNESPTLAGGDTVSIDENTPDATVVFDALVADDPDGDTLTWAIDSGDDSGAFAIDSNGVITVADSSQLDFETVESFTLEISVTDGGELSATDTVTINVSDLNESPTLAGGDTVSIDENTPNTTVVFDALVADDPDGDTLTWAIDSGNESGAFAIDSNGVITVADSSQLDFETVESFTLETSVTDGSEFSATDTVTINLNDLNESPTLSGGGEVTIDENTPDATVVFDALVADDPDGDTLTWAIDSGNESGAFAIDSNGVITVADSSQLDFETVESFTLEISVTDSGELSATDTVTINLSDLNESPMLAGGDTVSIDENTPDTTVVFDALIADDPDGDTLNWAIDSGNDSGAFAIDSNGVITVADSSQLDFESAESFTLAISVTDGSEFSATDTVTINLNDLNESPTLGGGGEVTIDENTPDATVVFDALIADDPDGDELTWAIAPGDDSGAFAIDSNGVITVADSSQLDFETVESFTLEISVTDGGELSATDTVTINLSDLNESPTLAGGDTVSIDENTPDTTVVFDTLIADDPDGDTLTWAIDSGNESGAFGIDSNGVITVADSSQLDFETVESFTLIVSVTDGEFAVTDQVIVDLIDVTPQFVVINTDDNGAGSLREAIELANLEIEDVTILFDIDESGPHDIVLTSALPQVENTVAILGDSDPDSIGIVGSGLTGIVAGLTLTADAVGSTVMGLSISGFGGDGILAVGGGEHTIQGNWIGVDTDGNAAGNRFGIQLSGSSDNTLDGNVISGNTRSGVYIAGSSTTNLLINNFVGTNVTGGPSAGNDGAGILVTSPGNVIGQPGHGNTVSGNTGAGVVLTTGSDGTTLQGNRIGTDASGEQSVTNLSYGVVVRSAGNLIGGDSTAGEGNLISANKRQGIILSGAGAADNEIYGNLIGTNQDGTLALGNLSYGIYVLNSSGTVIGDLAPGYGNVISGNKGSGVALAGTTDTQVIGNRIGTDVTGNSAVPNQASGVFLIKDAVDSLIADNQVAGNVRTGVAVAGAGSTGNLITSNLIGTNADGSAVIGNGTFAVLLAAPDNTLNGNVIAGSTRGVVLSGASATGNTVSSNAIGTDASGATDLGMTTGIQLVKDAATNTIGPDNLIANNGTGVSFIASSGNSNVITQNAFINNANVGIALTNGAPTANDVGDADEIPNRGQNHPEFDSSEFVAGGLRVVFAVPSDVANSDYDLTIEIYKSDAFGQGSQFITSLDYVTSDAGNPITRVIADELVGDLSPGDYISATATDAMGNTSEFSAAVMIGGVVVDDAPATNSSTGARSNLDTSADGQISPQDILVVLNELSENAANGESAAAQSGTMLEDVNGDGAVTPADALEVINWLAEHGHGSAQAEAAHVASLIDAVFADADDDDEAALLSEDLLF
ncbi:beta strand repeat-containing protein [Stieleria marina]|uniref:Probable pectate lyase C n=1 Tax=Stieleria marina TaxID=1930275 RepID=A0A517NW41_9BACT|nr:Cadherin domain protein [Planctomycetes bacterium K23_9]